ncbi:MAG: protein kinase [Acidobacteria bacterium]|nr:protein kinase [Acidobacteriota bacterium]
MSISIGTRFDRYEIISPLGAGGMGEVYLARDTRLGRKVALKLLLAEFTRDPFRLQRFEQEAKAASALNHPNIITIHEIGEFEAKHFITTEFIDGRTLRQTIIRGKLPPINAVDIAIQISSALAAAHETGIVHRDIKPENVMVRRDGIVKVLDFGLAKLTEPQYNSSDPDSPTFWKLDTDPGTVMGTASYMSPEQARGLKVDTRSDIFSLGVLIYEMVAGRAPFTGQSTADVISEVLNREPLPLSSSVSSVPGELSRIVNKALRKDREERYQTIKDLLVDLKSLKRDLETTITGSFQVNSGSNSGGKRISFETAVTGAEDISTTTPTERIIIRTTSSAEYLVSQIKQHKRAFMLSLGTIIAIFAGIFTYTENHSKEHAIESIAVLPFGTANNADENARMLSDAITVSIINNLTQLSSLNVKPRSAVLKYNGDVDAIEVAKALNVHAVLSGRIVKGADDILVDVALVDARDNRNLWGDQYKRKIADLLLLQQEISAIVSEKLRLKLSGDEKKRLAAQQLYLKGRNEWRKRTSDNIREGIRYFEEATKIDPSYAPAYAGLADCYNMLGNYSVLPSKEAHPQAYEAAQKALELDESLAEAHAAMAFIHYQWNWNWREAEREFKRAIELKPNYAPARQWYSSLLAVTGRIDEAISEAKQAQDLEPFSLIINAHLGWIYFLARNYENGMKQAEESLKLDPEFFASHRYMALAYHGQGKYNEAIGEFEKALSLSRGSTLLRAELGYAYAVAGKRNEAQAALEELQQMSGTRHISPYHLAMIHIGLGQKDRALELLNKAFDERSERLVWLRIDPRFDKMRSDPRFIDLQQRIGLTW